MNSNAKKASGVCTTEFATAVRNLEDFALQASVCKCDSSIKTVTNLSKLGQMILAEQHNDRRNDTGEEILTELICILLRNEAKSSVTRVLSNIIDEFVSPKIREVRN
jgi:hypothetical protein